MKITFGIRTNSQRPHKLAMGIHSILSQGIPADSFEVLITGKTDSPLLRSKFAQPVLFLPDSEAAEKGLAGADVQYACGSCAIREYLPP